MNDLPQSLRSQLADDRAQALELTPVSRETAERLDGFVALLLTWQARTQLVATSTLAHLWTRHVADSLQLVELAPEARTWIDLGSGGGFPGIVLACALGDRPPSRIHLVESNAKKAGFLREAARIVGGDVYVHAERIEQFVQKFTGPADAITARALAPLKGLLDQSFGLLKKTGAVALFHKGQDVEAELTEATKYWKLTMDLVPSLTEPRARIVVVRALERRRAARQ